MTDTHPKSCEACRLLELRNATLIQVAEHWLHSHQTYLRELEAAKTIFDIQALSEKGVNLG